MFLSVLICVSVCLFVYRGFPEKSIVCIRYTIFPIVSNDGKCIVLLHFYIVLNHTTFRVQELRHKYQFVNLYLNLVKYCGRIKYEIN